MRVRSAIIFGAFVLSGAAALAVEDAAIQLNHAGRLLTSSDEPVSGIVSITVGLYPAADAETPSWSATYVATVHQGAYALVLGDTREGRPALHMSDLVEERWLGVTVDDTPLSPRLRLSTVPSAAFAFEAGNARHLGGLPADSYLQKSELESFRDGLAAAGGNGLQVHWERLVGLPEDYGTWLATVETQSVFEGDGTAGAPLGLAEGGVELDRLATCGEGQVLKMVGTSWGCAVDTGDGPELTFDVEAPLVGTPGGAGARPKVSLADGGIGTQQLADEAVTTSKLAADRASLAKISQGALTADASGAVGVGVESPTARLEVAAFDEEGIKGAGSVDYAANGTTVTGSFEGLLPGDSIKLGTLGWATVLSVSAEQVTINRRFESVYGGEWYFRRATARVGESVLTALGEVGIGTPAPEATLDVAGDVRAGDVNAEDVSARTLETRSRGGAVTGVKWNPLSRVKVVDIPFSGSTTLAGELPATVPSHAVEVLVYAWVRLGGKNSDSDTHYRIYTHDSDGTEYSHYLFAHGYDQSAYAFNSLTQWLPVTPDRVVRVSRSGASHTGSRGGQVEVIGWR